MISKRWRSAGVAYKLVTPCVNFILIVVTKFYSPALTRKAVVSCYLAQATETWSKPIRTTVRHSNSKTMDHFCTGNQHISACFLSKMDQNWHRVFVFVSWPGPCWVLQLFLVCGYLLALFVSITWHLQSRTNSFLHR